MESRWEKVEPGTTKKQVLERMGPPTEFKKTSSGLEAYSWNMNAFTSCGVLLDKDEKVAQKECSVDREAQARSQERERAAAMMYMQLQQSQPTYKPLTPYQPARPQQTNCQTRWVGGTAYSDCTTNQTGLDSSIYR